MPLKNDKERLEYIKDEHNWLDYEYEHYLDVPDIMIKTLKGTNVCKIYVRSIPLYTGDRPRWIEIACKVFNERNLLTSIYDLSINQLIDYLRKNKI